MNHHSRNPFFFYKDDNPQTRHHVPPQHPDLEPRFILKVDQRHHRAYHLLFGSPRTFEEACRILKHDWFTEPRKQ